jgi:hypothetical protein
MTAKATIGGAGTPTREDGNQAANSSEECTWPYGSKEMAFRFDVRSSWTNREVYDKPDQPVFGQLK